MAGELRDKGLAVLRNGYNIIPIKPGTKAPDFKGWATQPTTEETLNRWLNVGGRSNYGIGITTADTPFLDVDVRDREMNIELREHAGLFLGPAPLRFGAFPKFGLIYRSDRPFDKLSSRSYADLEGRKAQVEILGRGQQFVAFAEHPDTHKPYYYHPANYTPETTPHSALTRVTLKDLKDYISNFEHRAEAKGWKPWSSSKETGRPGFAEDDDLRAGTDPIDDLTDEQIRRTLMMIPNDARFNEREDWIKVGFAVHHQTGGSEFGRELFHEWSAQHPSHKEELFNKFWGSPGKMHRGSPVTFRYVIKLAKEFDTRIVIDVRAGELHLAADEAERALTAYAAPLYVRDKIIMRPVVEDVAALHGQRSRVAHLIAVSQGGLIDYFSRSATWRKFDGRAKKMIASDPPDKVAMVLLSREGEWRLPRLAGITTIPTLRPDGSLLSEPGYDPATQVLLLHPPAMPAIPERPSRADAAEALGLLKSLLYEFPFVDEPSRSVAYSALITPVVRGVMPVAPLHLTRAPEVGSGKSYLVDLVCAIVLGQPCPAMAAGKSEEETEKRVSAAMMKGSPIISIDNLNGELGGDFLCQAVERPRCEARILGKSENASFMNTFSFFANGNNVTVVGDMVRRVVQCVLDANLERPELREFKSNPYQTVIDSRGRYIAACLTIVRAYIVARQPDLAPRLASFESWSDTVRSSLIWLGCADPVESMKATRTDDPIAVQSRQIVSAWLDEVGADNPKLASELIGDATSDLAVSLATLGNRGGMGADASRVGQWLRKNRNRIISGVKVLGILDSHTKHIRWYLHNTRDL